MTVKIYGLGWVGRSMLELFPDALVYDPGQNRFDEGKADVGFVCVPTPNLPNGSLDTSMVEEVISKAEEELIVIRSTVNPGTTRDLHRKYGKRLVVQPEYLGETPNHPMLDPHTRQFMVIGGMDDDRRKLIELYATVYNANTVIRQLGSYEAEVVKMTENRAIAFKVAQCQELYDVCELAQVDYYKIREAVYGDDPRFDLWFSFVYPDKRGMDSKCIPKDVYAWSAWAESMGYDSVITNAILKKNKEWISGNSSNS